MAEELLMRFWFDQTRSANRSGSSGVVELEGFFFWGERDWWWLLTSSKRIVPDNIIMMRTRSYFLSKLDVYHPRIEDQGQHTKPNAP